MSSLEFPSLNNIEQPYGPSSWRVRTEVWFVLAEDGSVICSSLLFSLVDLGRVEEPAKMICGLRGAVSVSEPERGGAEGVSLCEREL